MTAADQTFIDPEKLREYFWSLVSLNDDEARKTQETVRVELFLPPDLAERVDAAIGRRSNSCMTREHFVISTLLWALSNVAESDGITQMGLDIDS